MSKILITDDSILIRSVLKNLVKKYGHETIEANEGNEAIKKFKAESPDLIFMDIIMDNGMDGITACKKIKDIDPNAKIVMVTSVKEQHEEEEAKKLGIKDYINKPFSQDQIEKILKIYL